MDSIWQICEKLRQVRGDIAVIRAELLLVGNESVDHELQLGIDSVDVAAHWLISANSTLVGNELQRKQDTMREQREKGNQGNA